MRQEAQHTLAMDVWRHRKKTCMLSELSDNAWLGDRDILGTQRTSLLTDGKGGI